ncbi:MAG: hypothetical protein LRY74_01980 [Shewanella xiamenensis]|nr:hypothetical protein [Shewanella xiamenensis]
MSLSTLRHTSTNVTKHPISLMLQTVHKWLGLIVGLQLLIWVVTGLAFNLIDERFFRCEPISHHASNSESHYCTRPHG